MCFFKIMVMKKKVLGHNDTDIASNVDKSLRAHEIAV